MKKQPTSIEQIRRKIFFPVMVFILAFNPASQFLHAQQPIDTVPTMTVKYAGILFEKPVFQVQLNNQKKEWLELIITDDSNVELYSESSRNTVYRKRFQIDIPAENVVKLNFKLLDRNGNTVASYEVNYNQQTSYNISLTKL
jgi:hypothetical protein